MQHKIVIQRHRPWRRFALIAGLAAVLAFCAWGLYRYTRATTVSDFARARTELQQLREERRELAHKLRASRQEAERLKGELTYQQRSGEIDAQACSSVRESLAGVQAETSDLREQLAFYRAIAAPNEQKAGVRVQSLQLTPGAAGRVRYRLTLIQSTGQDKRISGRVDVGVHGRQGGEEKTLDAAMLRPASDEGDMLFSLRYFQELSGEWQLPPGFIPQQVRISLVAAEGAPKLEQKFDWQRLVGSVEKLDEVRH